MSADTKLHVLVWNFGHCACLQDCLWIPGIRNCVYSQGALLLLCNPTHFISGSRSHHVLRYFCSGNLADVGVREVLEHSRAAWNCCFGNGSACCVCCCSEALDFLHSPRSWSFVLLEMCWMDQQHSTMMM